MFFVDVVFCFSSPEVSVAEPCLEVRWISKGQTRVVRGFSLFCNMILCKLYTVKLTAAWLCVFKGSCSDKGPDKTTKAASASEEQDSSCGPPEKCQRETFER